MGIVDNIISIVILSLLNVIIFPPLTFIRKHEKNEKFTIKKWLRRCLYTFIISVIVITIFFVIEK
jgi:predicted permease